MSNIDQLRRLIDTMQPLIEPTASHTWTGPSEDQCYAFLQRAVVVRQWEALQALMVLADHHSAHFGVTLLRPAYEELIWLEFLHSVPADANRIVLLLATRGVAQSVTQQADYLGATVAKHIGWTRAQVASQRLTLKNINDELEAIGKRLHWKGGVSPTFRWLSGHVGRGSEYRFLYHATSSYVHFSPHELLRRVWGRYGTVSVSSSTFADHWVEFSAYWSMNTFVKLLNVVDESLLEGLTDVSNEINETILDIVKALQPVPIVTTHELERWRERPS